MTFVLVILRLLAVLSLDAERAEDQKAFVAPPGTRLELRSARAQADTPFCMSVVEERGPVSRAIGLGCYAAGPAEMSFTDSVIVGGGKYVVVLFRRAATDPPVTGIVTLTANREKNK